MRDLRDSVPASMLIHTGREATGVSGLIFWFFRGGDAGGGSGSSASETQARANSRLASHGVRILSSPSIYAET